MADPTVYVTAEGDVVDEVAFNYYGRLDDRVLERVYEANRGLADRGLRLPAGVRIELPEIRPPERRAVPGLFGAAG